MFDFLKRKKTVKIVTLIKFPPEDNEYLTKEICRVRIEHNVDGVTDCGHCTPESKYDLIVFADWKETEIDKLINLLKYQLPPNVEFRTDILCSKE